MSSDNLIVKTDGTDQEPGEFPLNSNCAGCGNLDSKMQLENCWMCGEVYCWHCQRMTERKHPLDIQFDEYVFNSESNSDDSESVSDDSENGSDDDDDDFGKGDRLDLVMFRCLNCRQKQKRTEDSDEESPKKLKQMN